MFSVVVMKELKVDIEVWLWLGLVRLRHVNPSTIEIILNAN